MIGGQFSPGGDTFLKKSMWGVDISAVPLTRGSGNESVICPSFKYNRMPQDEIHVCSPAGWAVVLGESIGRSDVTPRPVGECGGAILIGLELKSHISVRGGVSDGKPTWSTSSVADPKDASPRSPRGRS